MTKLSKIKKRVQKDHGKAKMTGLPIIRDFQVKSFMRIPDQVVLGGSGMLQRADTIIDIQTVKTATGFKPGDLSVFVAGRSSGKSSIVQAMVQKARQQLMSQPVRWETEPHGTQWSSYSLPFGLFSHRPLKSEETDEMKAFCEQTFGRGGQIGSKVWACDPLSGSFWFAKERDQIIFKMAFEGHISG